MRCGAVRCDVVGTLEGCSVDVRHDAGRHELRVHLPVLAVPKNSLNYRFCLEKGKKKHALELTRLVVPPLPMHKEHGKVDEIKVGHGGIKPGGEAPREAHDEVAEVVRVARGAPPAGDEQL